METMATINGVSAANIETITRVALDKSGCPYCNFIFVEEFGGEKGWAIRKCRNTAHCGKTFIVSLDGQDPKIQFRRILQPQESPETPREWFRPRVQVHPRANIVSFHEPYPAPTDMGRDQIESDIFKLRVDLEKERRKSAELEKRLREEKLRRNRLTTMIENVNRYASSLKFRMTWPEILPLVWRWHVGNKITELLIDSCEQREDSC